MSWPERRRILEELGAELQAPVLAYVTGDRAGLETQISIEQVARFPRHLAALGNSRRIALLIYTRGGDTSPTWPIVNFIRAYCEELIALVPFFAHGAGTLTCLGADQILMTPIATLSPITQSVANEFNPFDPYNPTARFPIAIEDLTGFFALAEQHGVAQPEDRAAAFLRLAQEVHPLALGHAHRSVEHTRQLAAKLIGLHAQGDEGGRVLEAIDRLTGGCHVDSHMITRAEAREIGLPVEGASERVETGLLRYYDALVKDLDLRSSFNPKTELPVGRAHSVDVAFERAYIETTRTADAYVSKGRIVRQPPAPIEPPVGPAPPDRTDVATFDVISDAWEVVA